MNKFLLSCGFVAVLAAPSPSLAAGVDAAKTGLELAQMGLGEIAIDQFEEALKATDLSPQVREKTLYNLGTVYLGNDRPDAALRSFDDALKISPRETRTLINRAEALRAMQRYDEALNSLDEALAIKASLSDAHYARGLNLMSKGQAADAETAFRKAISTKKSDPRYGIGLGRALLAQSKPKEALKVLNGVISNHRDIADAYIYRSSAYHGLNEKRKAGDDLNTAMRLAPNDPSIRAYYEQRRYGKRPVFYITKTDVDALSAPKAGAPVYQKLAKGTSVYSPECDDAGWCRVMFGETLAGYVKKTSLR